MQKDTIAGAPAEGRAAQGRARRLYGKKIANTATALNALAAKLSRGGSELRFCYGEAGAPGLWHSARQLILAGHGCVVVAPSLIPRKPEGRIKTDRRDALSLAKLHRAGERPCVVPDQAHEAIRDLVRARRRGRPQSAPGPSTASAGFPRHGPVTTWSATAWTLMHRRWMAGLRSTIKRRMHPCWKTASPQSRRRQHSAIVWAHIGGAAGWSLAPVVRALQALRGMALVSGTATVIAELGDITRFANPASSWRISVWFRPGTQRHHTTPRQHPRKPEMAQPDECWSTAWAIGSRRASAGSNWYARKVWQSRSATRRKAQERLCRRYRKLAHEAGKSPSFSPTAIARTGGLCLGDRQARSDRRQPIADRQRRHHEGGYRRQRIYPKTEQAGGTVTAPRTLASLSAGYFS